LNGAAVIGPPKKTANFHYKVSRSRAARFPVPSGDEPRHKLRVTHWAQLNDADFPSPVRGLGVSDFKADALPPCGHVQLVFGHKGPIGDPRSFR
jgi:hypothetical protein